MGMESSEVAIAPADICEYILTCSLLAACCYTVQ
jgi:hypothetical protein